MRARDSQHLAWMLVVVLAGCQASAVPRPGSQRPTAPPGFVPAACASVEVPGRTVTIHLPPGRHSPAPLLLSLHGIGASGRAIELESGLDQMADRVGALVAYPDALRGQWNQAPAMLGSEPDDVRFLVQLVDRLVAAGCADGRRVYAIGLSQGGLCRRALPGGGRGGVPP